MKTSKSIQRQQRNQVRTQLNRTKGERLYPIESSESRIGPVETENGESIQAGSPTVEEVCSYYLRGLELRGYSSATIRMAKDSVRDLADFVGTKIQEPVQNLTSSIVNEFLDDLIGRGLQPSRVRRVTHVVRSILRDAGVPCLINNRLYLTPRRPRQRRPDSRQIRAVIRRLVVPYRTVAELSVLTLMRISELVVLQRDAVNLADGIIHPPVSAAGGSTPIILSTDATQFLQEQLRRHASPWVFPGPHGQPLSTAAVSRRVRQAAAALGVPHFSSHDFRRYALQLAFSRNLPVHALMYLGRWKSPWTPLRHAVVAEVDLRKVVNTLAQEHQRGRNK